MHDLTGKIEPVHKQALNIISRSAGAEGVDWFLTGAMARDWILTCVHDIDTIRATRDADIAVALSSWDQFERLRQRIIASGHFQPEEGKIHRLRHSSLNGFHIDLVPYGPLGGGRAEIAWPPTRDVVLNVIGFEEVFRAAITVLADVELPVRVSSPPGLMLLKIFAWEDRRYEGDKDARDIRLLFDTYRVVAGERLWDEGAMALEDFQADLASARLLGRDVAAILTEVSRQRITSIVDRELARESAGGLVGDLLQRSFNGAYGEQDFGKMRSLVRSFRNGLDD